MKSVSGIRLFGFRLGFFVLAVYWCAMFTGTHLPSMPSGMPRVSDKAMHFTAFFFLATLLCYCTSSNHVWRRSGWIVFTCLVYAVIDESTQALVRGRTPDVRDFVADAAGTLLAVGVYFAIREYWRQRRLQKRLHQSFENSQSA